MTDTTPVARVERYVEQQTAYGLVRDTDYVAGGWNDEIRGYECFTFSDLRAVLAEHKAMAAEIERQAAEIAALRLTVGQMPGADIPEPWGCPCPGACQTVQEIKRLRAALADADSVVSAIELRADTWTAELMEARDAAINRYRARIGKGPMPGTRLVAGPGIKGKADE
jgi:hypothetical protein